MNNDGKIWSIRGVRTSIRARESLAAIGENVSERFEHEWAMFGKPLGAQSVFNPSIPEYL